MAVPPHHFDDEPAESQPGGLLGELERRQDEVLDKLDDLDAKLSEVLKGLESSSDQAGSDRAGIFSAGRPSGDAGFQLGDLVETLLDEEAADEAADDEDDDDDDFESAEDWA
ncbi:hypothetical protein Mal15_21800 [Stieleria maiorica]|uniref:Uncharacterized protein n=1 Tax=Stieleria maiorica TaxID=2795974 RepID=A0A5B9MBL3_9BACT|nr:hypothetical protein [Stieleria maiorica]QEF98133.1 hypothetical protein Mal15_21800 [Stieleria maiorica]